jgi:hypothetical protein
MDVKHTVGGLCRRMSRCAISGALTIASIGVAAQVTPMRYQHCEEEAPPVPRVHRIDTNYRYPPGASPRTLRDIAPYRCEAAWVQSPDIFRATSTCRYAITNCSADAFGTCHMERPT